MGLIFTDTCSIIYNIYILVTKSIAIRVIQGPTYTEFSIRVLPTLLTAIMLIKLYMWNYCYSDVDDGNKYRAVWAEAKNNTK